MLTPRCCRSCAGTARHDSARAAKPPDTRPTSVHVSAVNVLPHAHRFQLEWLQPSRIRRRRGGPCASKRDASPSCWLSPDSRGLPRRAATRVRPIPSVPSRSYSPRPVPARSGLRRRSSPQAGRHERRARIGRAPHTRFHRFDRSPRPAVGGGRSVNSLRHDRRQHITERAEALDDRP